MASPYSPPADEVLFGDIYEAIPSVHVEERPLRVARFFKRSRDRETWGVHGEDGPPPRGGFKWAVPQGGETILARAYLDRAIVLSHDCEIENDPRHRTVAMIRPMGVFKRDDWPSIDDMKNWAAFPLPADAAIAIGHSLG